MQKTLCTLLSFLMVLSVQFLAAQNQLGNPSRGEIDRKTQNEINQQIEYRTNPNTTAKPDAEKLQEIQNTKYNKGTATVEQELRALKSAEGELALRQYAANYFATHPQEATLYNNGNFPALSPLATVMQTQKIAKVEDIKFEKLSATQQEEIIKNDTALQTKYANIVSQDMNEVQKTELRKKLWLAQIEKRKQETQLNK